MATDRHDLDGLSADELRRMLAEVLDRLAGMAADDPERGVLVMRRTDLAQALRRVTDDGGEQLAAWASRGSGLASDKGSPYIASHDEGGGHGG